MILIKPKKELFYYTVFKFLFVKYKLVQTVHINFALIVTKA